MEWQPIETAPHGQPIIACWMSKIKYHPSPWVVGVCKSSNGLWSIELFGEQHECAKPTHWMPLPAPPESA